jgi:hypothetical protein
MQIPAKVVIENFENPKSNYVITAENIEVENVARFLEIIQNHIKLTYSENPKYDNTKVERIPAKVGFHRVLEINQAYFFGGVLAKIYAVTNALEKNHALSPTEFNDLPTHCEEKYLQRTHKGQAGKHPKETEPGKINITLEGCIQDLDKKDLNVYKLTSLKEKLPFELELYLAKY